MKKKIGIGIFGHYGNQNLGDEAITQSVIENLRILYRDCNLYCLSINPYDSNERYNIESFPIRKLKNQPDANNSTTPKESVVDSSNNYNSKSLKSRIINLPVINQLKNMIKFSINILSIISKEACFLSESKSVLKNIDIILVCGSNQFLDNFGGAWGFPYTLFKWTLLSRLNNVKVAFVSVGAGPLDKGLSYFFLKHTLKHAAFVSYRDNGSKDLIESRINNINGYVYPDLAHSLQSSKKIVTHNTNKNVIGINVMPVYDSRYWAEPNTKKYNTYIDKVSQICFNLIKRNIPVKLFTTQKKDLNSINDVVNTITNQIDDSGRSLISTVHSTTVDELMQNINSCEIIVATRFHATVLPMQLGIPVFGICYYRKSSELLDDVGLGDFHVDIDDISVDLVTEKILELKENSTYYSRIMTNAFNEYNSQLDSQYKKLIELIE